MGLSHSTKKKRRFLALGIGCLTILGIAIAIFLRVPANNIPQGSFPAGDAVVYFSPYAATNWAGDGGYVVAFDTAGAYSRFPTAGMGVGTVSWTQHGLFFADVDNDYIVKDDMLHVILSPKVGNQDGLVVLENGDWVGIYNGGFTPDGYNEEVVITSIANASKSTVKNWAPLVAACGNDVYSVYVDLEEYYETGITALGLSRIVHDGGHDETLIAHEQSIFAETDLVNSNAPCVNNEVVFLSGAYLTYGTERTEYTRAGNHQSVVNTCTIHLNQTGSAGCATIERWNVRTGQRSVIELKDETGLEIDLSPGSFIAGKYSADTIRDDQLYWWHPDGLLLSTDIYSGSTQLITVHERNADEMYEYLFDIVDDTAYVLMMPFVTTEDVGVTGTVGEFSLDTGELIAEYTFTNLEIAIGHNQIPWSFKVSPEIHSR